MISTIITAVLVTLVSLTHHQAGREVNMEVNWEATLQRMISNLIVFYIIVTTIVIVAVITIIIIITSADDIKAA